jgi:hypothetical protein
MTSGPDRSRVAASLRRGVRRVAPLAASLHTARRVVVHSRSHRELSRRVGVVGWLEAELAHLGPRTLRRRWRF